jgi:hypothetical protein
VRRVVVGSNISFEYRAGRDTLNWRSKLKVQGMKHTNEVGQKCQTARDYVRSGVCIGALKGCLTTDSAVQCLTQSSAFLLFFFSLMTESGLNSETLGRATQSRPFHWDRHRHDGSLSF